MLLMMLGIRLYQSLICNFDRIRQIKQEPELLKTQAFAILVDMSTQDAYTENITIEWLLNRSIDI